MTYDPSGQIGAVKAKRKYFQDMEAIQAEKKGKASGRKLGMAGSKAVKEFTEFMSPSEFKVPSIGKDGTTSLFKPTAPSGNLFDRIGTRLAGTDLSKAKLTKDAIASGYSIDKSTYKPLFGKPTARYDLKKMTSFTDKGSLAKPTHETVSTQYGGAGTKVGGLLGAYQLGTGLSTVFDPYASGTRKVAGGVNAALGANALLALGGANLWNPVGWGAGIVGLGATAADMLL